MQSLNFNGKTYEVSVTGAGCNLSWQLWLDGNEVAKANRTYRTEPNAVQGAVLYFDRFIRKARECKKCRATRRIENFRVRLREGREELDCYCLSCHREIKHPKSYETKQREQANRIGRRLKPRRG